MPMPMLNTDGGYRYAYQGQEKDGETGKKAFELRLWDSRIGRWLTTDPYGQHSSPYLGMGNNPIAMIDPDGGWKGKFGAWLYKTFNGGGEIVGEKGNWSVAQTGTDGGITFITNDLNGYNNNPAQILWNSDATRNLTGDSFSVSYGGGLGLFAQGEIQSEATFLLRGPDASFLPYINFFNTGGISGGTGGEATVTLAASKGFFSGSIEDMKATTLLGGQIYVNAGIAAIGGVEIEVSQSFNPKLDFREAFENTWTEVTVGGLLGAKAGTTAVDIQGGVRVNFTRIHPTKGFITVFD